MGYNLRLYLAENITHLNYVDRVKPAVAKTIHGRAFSH